MEVKDRYIIIRSHLRLWIFCDRSMRHRILIDLRFMNIHLFPSAAEYYPKTSREADARDGFGCDGKGFVR